MTTLPSDRKFSVDFNRFWLGVGIGSFATGIHRAAVPLIAVVVTSDPVFVGAIVASSRLPWLVISLKVGAWIDSRSPMEVVRVGVAIRAVVTAGLGEYLLVNQESAWVLCAFVFAIASGEVMGDTSSQVWIALSQKHTAFPAANARIYGTQVVLGQLLGPAIAGLLISRATYLSAALCALLQVIAASTLWRMSSSVQALPSRSAPDNLGSHGSVFRHVVADRCLTGLVMLGMVSMLVYGMWLTATVLFATDRNGLGLTPVQYGFLMLSMACGSLVGAMAMPRLLRATNGWWCVAASCVGVTALPLGGAVSSSVVWVVGSMFVYGLLLSAWNVSAVSFRQATVPIRIQGRVNALYRLASWGAMPIGAGLAGLLCAHSGPRLVFEVCVLLSLLQYPAPGLLASMKSYRG